MPELPEVETTRRGIAPRLEGARILTVNVRNPHLRWPVPADISSLLGGQVVDRVRRRAKYLLLETAAGAALIHLGMSGSLKFTDCAVPPGKHDHYDIELESGEILRYRDPRRFGSLLWAGRQPDQHALLRNLGPEPLSAEFDASHLYRASRGRRIAIKPYLMNASVVVGVGNIYANESLFRAGIHPRKPAGRVSRAQISRLAEAVKAVLAEAIEVGGTTLRDFHGGDGRPGYFRMSLQVYDRAGEPCVTCAKPITHAVIAQRSTFYCTRCQR